MKNLLTIKHHGDAPSIYANDDYGNGFGKGQVMATAARRTHEKFIED